ncbi:hypothetical protein KC352_g30197, partial [Hortaea werneckii]
MTSAPNQSPRYILSAGFGRFAQTDPNATAHFGPNAGAHVRELLQNSISQARAAGFEIIPCDINPQEPEESFQRSVTRRIQIIVGLPNMSSRDPSASPLPPNERRRSSNASDAPGKDALDKVELSDLDASPPRLPV